jgi:transposase
MQHRNALLTPLGRRRLVALVEEDGLTFEAAAAASNVSRSTAHTWVWRWRRAGEADRRTLACLEDRSSAPRRRPSLAGEEVHDRVCERRRRTGWRPRLIASELDIPHATVLRCLRRCGLSHRLATPKGVVLRFEWPCPGEFGARHLVRAGAVAGSVVGEAALNADPHALEPGRRPLQEAGGGRALLVGQDLRVGQAGGVIDADVDELPAGGSQPLCPDLELALAVARDPVPAPLALIRPSFLTSTCTSSPGRLRS